ncbi:MAG: DMT family transporter [Methylocystis sp.]|nr:DMT family transporter [Methylocystis sp.]MCA3587482.1 DMT family transporter [Methylocystis sp.]MCA3591027.1 DMT family transporter [Methylocystis sp.]
MAGIAGGTGAGIALRLLATLFFSLMSLSVRLASVEAPVGQIVFWRSAVALVPILVYLAWRRQLRHGLRTERPLGHVMRSLYGCAAMFFSFLSIAHLPLALATALSFLAPLIVVPLAIATLGERPGIVVVAATLLGFLGVGLMLWPAMVGPELAVGTLIGVGAGLACAATTALAKTEIKRLTATEAPAAIAFYFAIICAAGGLATLPFGWASVGQTALIALIASGVFGGLAHIAMTEAVARAPVSTLAPFEYTAMIWALLFDLIIFALWPGFISLLGALLIVSAAACVAFADRIGARLKGVPA